MAKWVLVLFFVPVGKSVFSGSDVSDFAPI